MSELCLAFGMSFAELYTRDGLVKLDVEFCDQLKQDAALYARFMAARTTPPDGKAESELLIDLALKLEDFIVQLFGIEREMDALVARHRVLNPLYTCKRLFVQRRAAKALTAQQAVDLNGEMLEAELSVAMGEGLTELSFATHVLRWMEIPEEYAGELANATQYAAWALHADAGQKKHATGVLFKQPKKLDPQSLVPVETEEVSGVRVLRFGPSHLRPRDGFALTDPGGDLVRALDEAHYCIYCHHQEKDSCSKGMHEKDGGFKRSPFGVPLAGCPLEEKISEMNQLKAEAVPLGALAVAVVDNPMIAGTGHRICNDCMKSCIFQKQEPVNIPLQETRTLRDILELPWGFEIYSLLTRWNPLNLPRPLPRPPSEKKVLIAGLGPAGYTLAHHLMNDGHVIVGIDGLKLEPLSSELSGVEVDGTRVPFLPIRDIEMLEENLAERTLAGFGGVAEYGITVRWDKNYLKLLRLLLERRDACALHGGVRFGGTITKESAFALGFDHIALCMGAGRPTVLDIPGGMRRGVRAASDFLMALQLTGAAKKDSIANLQLRLPVVVIGGGLTAIDTATEALAYYPVQVEKFLARHEALAAEQGEANIFAGYGEEELGIAQEFLSHARAIRAEREAARAERRVPDLLSLLNGWGGATVAYRKRLQDAPSYRLNHEEIEKAMEEGIRFTEHLTPLEILGDEYGHVSGVGFQVSGVKEEADTRHPAPESFLPARAVLVAAGTSPNTVLAREDESFALDGQYFQAVDEAGDPVTPERSAKPGVPQMLLAREADGKAVSFFGDLHPSFAGNVVKAMASAKQGYPMVSRVLAQGESVSGSASPDLLSSLHGESFLQKMRRLLSARVHAVHRLTPTIVEVILEAPLAAKEFQPGQFFRLQNFEAHARQKTLEAIVKATPDTAAIAFRDGETVSAKLISYSPFFHDVNYDILESNQPASYRGSREKACYLAAAADIVSIDGKQPYTLAMEGLAMTGAWVDKEKGLVSCIVLEMGGSSDLCALLTPGEPVVLMGPTGTPTEIPEKETVLLAGGGLGNAVLFSIGKAMREKGCRVLYFAGYRAMRDRYKLEEIEAAADVIVWCSDEAPGFAPTRPQDFSFTGNIVEAMAAYGKGELKPRHCEERSDAAIQPVGMAMSRPTGWIAASALPPRNDEVSISNDGVSISFSSVDRIIAIGSDRMMAAVAAARKGPLAGMLGNVKIAIGSINSPMQCMMKEICAQCLQLQVDPETGQAEYVFSCFNQDQALEKVSFDFLRERLKQNAVQERQTALWIARCLPARGLHGA